MNNILSLFDGISCGQLALSQLGLQYGKYFASEIDKAAISITQKHFPNTIQLGDVSKLNTSNLPKIDLLIGGSPCTNFSIAGNRIGMVNNNNNELKSLHQYLELKKSNINFKGQSYLFWEYARILKEVNPKYFLLENVKMKKEWENVISKELGVEPIEINSSLVSAQSRRRLYWTNIPVTKPKDLNIKLDDILDKNINEYEIYQKVDKSLINLNFFSDQDPYYILAKNGKKVIITNKEPPYSFYENRTEKGKLQRKLIRRKTGKDSNGRDKEHRIYVPQKHYKSNCIVTIESPLDYILDRNYNYRKLTRSEMERLQTLPVGYLSDVSNSKFRKLIGNSWTVNVIVHILKGIKND